MSEDFPSSFPKLADLIGGTKVDKTLGFIDVTGTKAYVSSHLRNPTWVSQVNLSQIQSAFSSVLASIAQNKPNIEVILASDGAFIVGTSSDVLEAIVESFVMIPGHLYGFKLERLAPLPMRAALAKGLVQLQVSPSVIRLKNFSQIPYWGEAFTKVHLMEKSRPKGMRIFITKSVADELPAQQKEWVMEKPVGKVSVFGQGSEQYFQSNWLLLPPLGGIKAMGRFVEVGRIWAASNDKHFRKFGRSIVEMSGKDAWLYNLPPPLYKLLRKLLVWKNRRGSANGGSYLPPFEK